MFDYARVQQTFVENVAGTPESIIQRLVSAADSWMSGVVLDDDITLLVIRKTEDTASA
jgi:serine phosphatase RsbU (regulator of sigma subunit)